MMNAIAFLGFTLRNLVRPANRSALTPGDLYRRMSAELRYRQPKGHHTCAMPMVVFRRRRTGVPNWTTESLTTRCAECAAIVDPIVRRHAARFDIIDFTPVPRRKSDRLAAGD